MIAVKKITYVPADIFAMNGAPQLVLAAPPAGYVNNILGISHDMTFNSAAYTVATTFRYGAVNLAAGSIFGEDACLGAITDRSVPAWRNGTGKH